MNNDKGIPLPEVQQADIPAPLPAELLVIVKKQKAVVNQSRFIKTQIDELSEKLGDLNNTALDDLADELDLISERFETLRTSLLERLGVDFGE